MTRALLSLLLAWALSASGQVLILHKGDDSLGVYDAASGKLVEKIPTGSRPHEFAVTADEGFAFVSNYGVDSYTEEKQGGNTLTVIDLRQRKAVGEIPLGEHHRPHGIHLAWPIRAAVRDLRFPPIAGRDRQPQTPPAPRHSRFRETAPYGRRDRR